ncbi:MAG: hypothetical protein JNL18_17120 [Planctomycetaceae bacterium]|nr:hypothetical protein [Planctomycetaceae bacterium]
MEPTDRVDLNINGLRGYVERDICRADEWWNWVIRLPRDDGRFFKLDSSYMVRPEWPFKTKEAALESLYEVMAQFEINEVVITDETDLSELQRIARGE